MYSGKKKSLSRLLKQQVKKVDNLGFFQNRQSMVLVKNWQCFYLYIIGKIGQEKCVRGYSTKKKKAFPH